jgi:hypothetical protein
MKHELWKEKNGFTFCLAGSMGDGARAMMENGAELIWTVEAASHFEAMTKYCEYMDWGEYKTEFEQDKNPYPNDWIETQN